MKTKKAADKNKLKLRRTHDRQTGRRGGAKREFTITQRPPPPPLVALGSMATALQTSLKSPGGGSGSRQQRHANRRAELLLLSAGLFIFFGFHNYLQERIMAMPGWKYGSMLGLLEALGLALCTGAERACCADKGSTKRRAPWRAFLAIAAVVALSAMLSNSALDYINYPVKVVFRSAKVIPTMLVGVLLRGRAYAGGEYGAALLLTLGLIAFGFADFSVSPRWSPFGLLLVALSVCADAFTPNLQVRPLAVY